MTFLFSIPNSQSLVEKKRKPDSGNNLTLTFRHHLSSFNQYWSSSPHTSINPPPPRKRLKNTRSNLNTPGPLHLRENPIKTRKGIAQNVGLGLNLCLYGIQTVTVSAAKLSELQHTVNKWRSKLFPSSYTRVFYYMWARYIITNRRADIECFPVGYVCSKLCEKRKSPYGRRRRYAVRVERPG